VVLKILRQLHPSPEQVARFRHEYEMLGSVHSDAVATARAFETDQRRWALVQDDIGATALSEQLPGLGLGLAERLDIAIAVTAALRDTHAQGLIHKDINPSNIVRNADTGAIQLIDFGLATALASESPGFSNRNRLEGTLRYLSPEQTGRVAARVDYRSDLYSLGATLYELFAGRPPFESDDALELVHAHIARRPDPLEAVAPGVPSVLSAIVMRLLEKGIDERYKSARGLLADLQRCRAGLMPEGTIEPFEIGLDDATERLMLPPRLYGRAEVTGQLVQALARTEGGDGTAEPTGVLITGPSGMGKTAVVQSLFGPLTERHGYYIEGKFDQVRRTPFSAVVAAFRALVTELLGESEERLARLRNDLAAALGPNSKVIVDVIPQVELITGPPPPVTELGAAETTSRFERVFRSFVRVFARPQHPVVLFLDDLQWADPASLSLVRGLLTDERQALLVVGAYRDNEVDAAHPLTAMLKALRDDGVTLPELALQPLTAADVAQLIGEATGCTSERVAPLAALVVRNSEGNPLFVREFLGALGRDGLIRPDHLAGGWTWDLDEIRAKGFTQSALELMTQRLGGLESATREVLQAASCVGATFDLTVLASLRGESVSEVWCQLLPAIQDGMVVATSELDALIADDDSPDQTCSFFHDRIQQAAYESMAEDERTRTHLAIGRLLVDRAVEGSLFEVVFQLNRGRALIEDEAGRLRLAHLNLDAGRRAAGSAAWQAAADYFDAGLALLPDGAWRSQHALTMDLTRAAGEVAYALSEFDRSAELTGRCLEHAESDLQRADLYVTLVQQRTTSGDYPGSLDAMRAGLSLLGYDVPADGYMDAMLASFGELQALLAGAPPSSFLDRPQMTDPVAIAQCRLLSWAMASAFYTDPLLYSVIGFEAMKRIAVHGTPHDAVSVFAQYGHLLGALFGDPRGGYEYTVLARQLCDKLGNQQDKAEACFLSGNFALGWVEPMRTARAVLEEGLQAGLQSGGLQFARYNLVYLGVNDFLVGEPLEGVLRDATEQQAYCARWKDVIALDCSRAVRMVVNNLLGNTSGALDFSLEGTEEAAWLEKVYGNQTPMLVCYFLCFKLAALAVHREHAAALEASRVATELVATIPGNINIGRLAFHTGLSIAGVLPDLEGEEQAQRTEQLDGIVEQLAGYAALCEANWGHTHALVAAEVARLQGDGPAAIAGYETAIRLAEEHRWHQDHAMACELAGRYWHAQGRSELSLGYLAQARYGYALWGAARKVAQLDAEFPGLVQEAPGSRTTSSLGSVSVTSTEASTGQLDLASVIKASQAISGELDLDRLIGRLLELVLENAGAGRGVLVVVDDDELAVRAAASMQEGEDGGQVLVADVNLNISLDSYGALSPTLVNYVARTSEPVVLNDALGEGRFTADPYIVRTRSRSVLCLPLRASGVLIGLLYLENRLVTGAFTEDRLEIVGLLASQFAISFENARLYNEMEAKVARRTEQLAHKNLELEGTLDDLRVAQSGLVARNEFIHKLFGRYVSDDVVEHLLADEHRLELGGERRPITVLASDVRGFTSLAERLEPEAVLALLNRYFESMFEVIHRHGGTINAILGDGLFVFFGAPIPQADASRRAVACALEMMLTLEELKEGADSDMGLLEMGIGVHSGVAVVGNIGSQDRTKYSAIGLDVNLAARIEGCTVGGQILVSEAVEAATRPDLVIAGSMEFSAKGVATPMTLYEVEGLGGDSPLRYRRDRSSVARLETAIRVDFSVVSGGVVAPTTYSGSLVRLSADEAELQTDAVLAPLTDVRVQVFDRGGERLPGHLYGKVLAHEGAGTRLGFTSVPPAMRAWLQTELVSG